MGVKLRERPGKGWYVLTDWKGQRKAKCFGKNKALAKEFAGKLEAKLKLESGGIPCRSGITFAAYAASWLEGIAQTRKHSTHEDYADALRRHLLPAFGALELEDVTRERVRTLAWQHLKAGRSYKTVLNLIRCLSSLLSQAVEDGHVSTNPALRPGKFLPKASKRHAINPLTREDVIALLDTARARLPRAYPLLLCAVRTGLRLGELLALQWDDLDVRNRFVEVRRNYTRGVVTTPKNGESRRVDMSLELVAAFKALQVERQLEAAANGWAATPPWVFCSETGGLMDQNNVRRRVFYRVLKTAGLRQVRFHDLRHTFASLLLQQGESPVYVKEQMGHSSIQVTVDIYGHLIPGGNRQAVDRLDGGSDSGESATQAQPLTGQAIPIPEGEDGNPVDCAGEKMARPEGFEPPTYGFVVRRSIQLSYGRVVW